MSETIDDRYVDVNDVMKLFNVKSDKARAMIKAANDQAIGEGKKIPNTRKALKERVLNLYDYHFPKGGSYDSQRRKTRIA